HLTCAAGRHTRQARRRAKRACGILAPKSQHFPILPPFAVHCQDVLADEREGRVVHVGNPHAARLPCKPGRTAMRRVIPEISAMVAAVAFILPAWSGEP